MTVQGPGHPGKDWETEINALQDGELDETSAEALKAAAAADSRLAAAIVEAWQLQKSMDELRPERAPASLRRKLRRIPRQQTLASRKPWLGLPGSAPAGAMAAVVLIALVVLIGRPGGMGLQPGAARSGANMARVEQTRRDLATAFHYLDKVGLRVGREIRQDLNDELSAPIKDSIYKHLPYTGQGQKEKQA
jgi:hypothetical protein